MGVDLSSNNLMYLLKTFKNFLDLTLVGNLIINFIL